MPLTDEQRQRILSRRQGAGQQVGPTRPGLPTLPGGLQVQGATLSRNPSIRLGLPKEPEVSFDVESRRQAKRTGLRVAETAKAKEKVEFASVKASFATALALADKVPPPEPIEFGVSGKQKFTIPSQMRGFALQRPRKFSAKELGTEPELNEFLTFGKSVLGQLAKVVSREGGRLTDQDIERVEGLLIQIPFLPIEGRLRRMKTINTVVVGKGFPPLFDIPGTEPLTVPTELSGGSTTQLTPEQRGIVDRLMQNVQGQ